MALLAKSSPDATTLENRVRQLEKELRRVERDRDITTTPGADHSALDYLTPEEFEAGSR